MAFKYQRSVTTRPLEASDAAQLQRLYVHCFREPGQSRQEVMEGWSQKVAPYLSEPASGTIDYSAWVANEQGEAKGLLLVKTRTTANPGEAS